MLWSLHGGDRRLLLTHAGAPPDQAAVEAIAFMTLPGSKTGRVLLSCGGERGAADLDCAQSVGPPKPAARVCPCVTVAADEWHLLVGLPLGERLAGCCARCKAHPLPRACAAP